jgi:hypothetical protein
VKLRFLDNPVLLWEAREGKEHPMGRDPEKLRVFQIADPLVVKVYGLTQGFPGEE